MFPRFTDIINYFLGTNLSFPIQTYGFFVAFSFLFGAWILKKEIFRKEKQGLFQPIRQRTLKGAPAKVSELIITAVAGFILGYKFVGIITSYSLFDENPQEYFFSMQGSIIGGIAVAALLAYNRYRTKKKQQLEEPVWEETEIPAHKLAGNILIIAAVSGILGAKIFHNLENIDELIKDPVGSIFSFMGLTFYGGLIVGSITVLWYLKKKKMTGFI